MRKSFNLNLKLDAKNKIFGDGLKTEKENQNNDDNESRNSSKLHCKSTKLPKRF